MDGFTPMSHALAGGVLIGLGSLIAAAASGRIPGVSGILSQTLMPRIGEAGWRIAFLFGLVAGAGVAFVSFDGAADYHPLRSLRIVAIAGVLVGFGARLGGGCTSGHGVCGLGLGSRPGIVATLVFMAAAVLTVLFMHTPGPEVSVR